MFIFIADYIKYINDDQYFFKIFNVIGNKYKQNDSWE